MNLAKLVHSLTFALFLLVDESQENPLSQSDEIKGILKEYEVKKTYIQSNDEDNDDDTSGNMDFEDDDTDGLDNMIDSNDININSLMHLHAEKGQLMVPCFGMWWPVGGGGGGGYYYYDYGGGGGGGDYGDYRKKRRRSRQRKKAAKKKKKKA